MDPHPLGFPGHDRCSCLDPRPLGLPGHDHCHSKIPPGPSISIENLKTAIDTKPHLMPIASPESNEKFDIFEAETVDDGSITTDTLNHAFKDLECELSEIHFRETNEENDDESLVVENGDEEEKSISGKAIESDFGEWTFEKENIHCPLSMKKFIKSRYSIKVLMKQKIGLKKKVRH